MPKNGIGYAHAMIPLTLRRARSLVKLARAALDILSPETPEEERLAKNFRVAIEKFEEADR